MRNIEYQKLFKEKLRSGKILAGTMVQELDGPRLIKVLEESGYDFFFIDCEHGIYSMESVSDMIIAADHQRIVPIVRIAEIRKEAILKVLDAGAAGIMAPSILSADDAREVVKLSRFRPDGLRGFSTFKYFSNYSTEHASKILYEANKALTVIMQIETREAAESIDEIAAVKGIDALLVGPGDLSLSYGHPGEPRHPDVVAMIRKIIRAAKDNNLGAGIHCGDLDDLMFWKDNGMNMLMWSSPHAMIYNSSITTLEWIRKEEMR
jgi:2-keto-3-deoxy-L-rhamnonate aldolase RhmA